MAGQGPGQISRAALLSWPCLPADRDERRPLGSCYSGGEAAGLVPRRDQTLGRDPGGRCLEQRRLWEQRREVGGGHGGSVLGSPSAGGGLGP